MPGRYKRPVTAAERERREQASADKLTALHQRLGEQVAALRSGSDWRDWLDTARRFHTYSFNNVLLIAGQRPDATAVAGYEAWKALGRQVDKGEKGIQILAPVVHRGRPDRDPAAAGDSQADGSDRPGPAAAPAAGDDGPLQADQGRGRGQVTGFRVTYVWDVSQTSGDPLPTPPAPQLLRGQAPPGLWDALAGLVADRGFTLERGDCAAAANGVTDYAARTVRIRDDVDAAQAVKTLAHELAHVLLHDPASADPSTAGTASSPRNTGDAGTTGLCQGVREVEAESVAYLVAATHGLPTDDYTFAYVAGWASADGVDPQRVVRDTGQRVLTATRAVLAVTTADSAGPADPVLADRAQVGAERAAAARQHAEATLALAQPLVPTRAATPTSTTTATAATGGDLDILARLHTDATAFYSHQLQAAGTAGATHAAAVLTGRAVPAADAAAYELGYAPAGWTALTDHLRGLGYTDRQLLDAGVGMATRRGTVVDRFRDRLMFPVRDASGDRVVAFLGRALTEGDGIPKYLNSPETALYRKAETLYGLGAAPTRQALAAGARPVLVEGALDAIAVTCSGAGQHAGVAPSGTALTAGQVAALDRHAGPPARDVVVAFDADPAGRDAAVRAFPLLRAAGGWPAAAVLPDGQDPAGLLQQHGPQALRAALEAATPLASLVLDERLSHWSDRLQWVEGTLGAARDAAQLIATLPPEHVSAQVVHVARALGLDHSDVTGAVVDALTREADAPGRLARRDRREDLDRTGPPVSTVAAAPLNAAQLARTGYPAALRASTTGPPPASAASGRGPQAQRAQAVSGTGRGSR